MLARKAMAVQPAVETVSRQAENKIVLKITMLAAEKHCSELIKGELIKGC